MQKDNGSVCEVEAKRQCIARALGFLTAEEVALLAGVKASTLMSWRKRRIGPVYAQFGNEQLYLLEDVSTYLKQIKKVDCHSNILAFL